MTMNRTMTINDDGSKTYTTIFSYPGVKVVKKVTTFDVDTKDESARKSSDIEDILDRITIKEVKKNKSCKANCDTCKGRKDSDDVDFLSKLCDDLKSDSMLEDSEIEKDNISVLDEYDALDLKGLYENLNELFSKPENFKRLIDLCMEIYKESKE